MIDYSILVTQEEDEEEREKNGDDDDYEKDDDRWEREEKEWSKKENKNAKTLQKLLKETFWKEYTSGRIEKLTTTKYLNIGLSKIKQKFSY